MGRPENEITVTDGELVRLARNGQTGAYAQLVRRWSARVLAICHARVGRPEAEDLAQETLLRGFRSLDTLTVPDKFGPWLGAIAQRVCLDWLKSKQRSQVLFTQLSTETNPVSDLAICGDTALAAAESADELHRLMSEVDALSEKCREVLLLYYYNDLTYRDLAELLGVSTATINARLTRARSELRERMSKLPR